MMKLCRHLDSDITGDDDDDDDDGDVTQSSVDGPPK